MSKSVTPTLHPEVALKVQETGFRACTSCGMGSQCLSKASSKLWPESHSPQMRCRTGDTKPNLFDFGRQSST
eukprot:5236261-Amphidinium_carterae.1